MTAPATHTSLFYDGGQEYATGAGGFLRAGLEDGHRGLVVAPTHRVDLLRSALGRDADEVAFIENTTAYAPQWNVYRLLFEFLDTSPEVRACIVAEQALADRVPAEVVDYRRLEAAANLVFAGHAVDMVCPYDAGSLPAHLLEIGLRAHAGVLTDGRVVPNAGHHDPLEQLAVLSTVVAPPPDAVTLDCSSPADVAGARRLVRARGAELGLAPDVVADVALAVTEVLTNALEHGAAFALLHLYDAGPTWVCHVHDGGLEPLDPLAGLVPPAEPSDHGYGLWLARQVCAAVDVGTNRSGTHVRLHTRTSLPVG